MNTGAALWNASNRPLPHLQQPTHRPSPFSQQYTMKSSTAQQQQRFSNPLSATRTYFSTATTTPPQQPPVAEAVASAVKQTATKTAKTRAHDGLAMYGPQVWESLITESTVRLNKYLEIIGKNDRKASGMDNNRQIWTGQRVAPAILHDKFRHISHLPGMERSNLLLNLWLSAVDFKPKMAPAGYMVNAWLATLILLVMGMVSAGGVTRLTRSGLSMTTWKFTGEKRPTNDEEWEEEFNLYKQSPEYRLHNSDMELKDFKFIYHMEYGHRTLGRVIGLAFTIPLLGFLATGGISLRTGFGKALVGVLSLGGLQGLIGWWMVKSGLDEKTNVEKAKVSPYRLATHLTIAFTLLVGLTVLKLRAKHGITEVFLAGKLISKKLPNIFGFSSPRGLCHATAMFAFFTAMTGAFVAGNDAGLVYNEWPEMGEGMIPGDLINPHLSLIRNCFENPTLVQFVHRNMAYSTFTFSWLTALSVVFNRATPGLVANAAMRTALLTTMQAGLGIYTLLNYVPTEAAALHQFGAMLVLMSATQTLYYSLNPQASISQLSQSIRYTGFVEARAQTESLKKFNERVQTFMAQPGNKAKEELLMSVEKATHVEQPFAGKVPKTNPVAAAAAAISTPKVNPVAAVEAHAAAAVKINPSTAASVASKVNKSSAILFAAAGLSMMALPSMGRSVQQHRRPASFKD